MTTFDLVVTALTNAEVNGYAFELEKLTDEQLADDLRDCDADVAKCSRSEVIEAVTRIRCDRWKSLSR